MSLDKSTFTQRVPLVALRIAARQCTTFTKKLEGHIFHRRNVRPIIKDELEGGSAQTKLLLLAETVTGIELEGLPEELRSFVAAEGAQPIAYEHVLGYEHLTAEQVLRRLLPAGMEVPSSFEQVGHVAHVNLREEQLPFKSLIGQVLLDKNSPRVRTVVNKVESLSRDGTAADQRTPADERAWRFRVFPMEVLAGEDSLVTSVRENGATFRLDFREVYWNSRLEREHRRIVELLRPDDVVCDMMAGIGPFAVPAAIRGSRVYANDLNPQSAHWLRANVAANKVQQRVRTYNQDARAFLQLLLAPPAAASDAPAPAVGTGASADASAASSASSGYCTEPGLPFGTFSHVFMNLPASALTFLDVFVGAFDRERWHAPLPRVHCHCFSKAEDPAADVIAQAEATIGCALPGATARVVRDVSPHKLMMCVEFQLPDAVCWTTSAGVDDEQGAERKRQRLDADE